MPIGVMMPGVRKHFNLDGSQNIGPWLAQGSRIVVRGLVYLACCVHCSAQHTSTDLEEVNFARSILPEDETRSVSRGFIYVFVHQSACNQAATLIHCRWTTEFTRLEFARLCPELQGPGGPTHGSPSRPKPRPAPPPWHPRQHASAHIPAP